MRGRGGRQPRRPEGGEWRPRLGPKRRRRGGCGARAPARPPALPGPLAALTQRGGRAPGSGRRSGQHRRRRRHRDGPCRYHHSLRLLPQFRFPASQSRPAGRAVALGSRQRAVRRRHGTSSPAPRTPRPPPPPSAPGGVQGACAEGDWDRQKRVAECLPVLGRETDIKLKWVFACNPGTRRLRQVGHKFEPSLRNLVTQRDPVSE